MSFFWDILLSHICFISWSITLASLSEHLIESMRVWATCYCCKLLLSLSHSIVNDNLRLISACWISITSSSYFRVQLRSTITCISRINNLLTWVDCNKLLISQFDIDYFLWPTTNTRSWSLTSTNSLILMLLWLVIVGTLVHLIIIVIVSWSSRLV